MSFTPNTLITGSVTNANGTGLVTAANTDYLALVTAQTYRKFLSITNTGAMGNLVVNPSGLAYQGGGLVGIIVAPGQTYQWTGAVPTGALHVASAMAGVPYFVLAG